MQDRIFPVGLPCAQSWSLALPCMLSFGVELRIDAWIRKEIIP